MRTELPHDVWYEIARSLDYPGAFRALARLCGPARRAVCAAHAEAHEAAQWRSRRRRGRAVGGRVLLHGCSLVASYSALRADASALRAAWAFASATAASEALAGGPASESERAAVALLGAAVGLWRTDPPLSPALAAAWVPVGLFVSLLADAGAACAPAALAALLLAPVLLSFAVLCWLPLAAASGDPHGGALASAIALVGVVVPARRALCAVAEWADR